MQAFANISHYLHSERAGKSDKGRSESVLTEGSEKEDSVKYSEGKKPLALTESGDRRKLMTGLLNCSKFSSSYVSNDHKQIVASVDPDTKTSLVELMATQTTGPR